MEAALPSVDLVLENNRVEELVEAFEQLSPGLRKGHEGHPQPFAPKHPQILNSHVLSEISRTGVMPSSEANSFPGMEPRVAQA